MAKGMKTGGRKAGTPNRQSQRLVHLLNERFADYDPLVAMAEIANDDTVDVKLRLSCHKEIASYLYPKRTTLAVNFPIRPAPIDVGKPEEPLFEF